MFWYLFSLFKVCIKKSNNLFYQCGIVIGTGTLAVALVCLIIAIIIYLP
jgi:hypothetical protein